MIRRQFFSLSAASIFGGRLRTKERDRPVSGFSNPIIGGGGGLVYPSIHSPNFRQGPPLVGWSIDKNGNAYFANVTISGTFTGTDWVITENGSFFYNGTPGLGNPPIAWSTPPGVTQDSFGNTLPASGGFVSEGGGGAYSQLAGGVVKLQDSAGKAWDVTAFEAAGSPYLAFEYANAAVFAFLSSAGNFTAAAPGTANPEAWHPPTLGSGFSSAGSPLAAVGYQYEPVNGGRVRLRGQVNLTAAHAAGTTIFTLPAGYVPAFESAYMTPNSLSSYALGNSSLVVTSAGAVNIAVAGSNGNFVILDGVVIELD